MKIMTYENGLPTGQEKEMTDEMLQKIYEVALFLMDCGPTSVWGVGMVSSFQSEIAALTAQSNQNGALCDEAQDALEAVLDRAEQQQKELSDLKRERDMYRSMAVNNNQQSRFS